MLVKTPLAYLGLFAVAAVSISRRSLTGDGRESEASSQAGYSVYDLAPLLVLVTVYFTAAVWAKVNIGHRHLLPVLPALFVLCGAGAAVWRADGRDSGARNSAP